MATSYNLTTAAASRIEVGKPAVGGQPGRSSRHLRLMETELAATEIRQFHAVEWTNLRLIAGESINHHQQDLQSAIA